MIKRINKVELDNFVSKQKYSQFLQSSIWADFQEQLNNNVWLIAYSEENKILGSAVIIEKKLPAGFSYLYLPRGPIVSDSAPNKNKVAQILLKGVRDISIQTIKRNEIFFRLEPNSRLELTGLEKIKNVQPTQTLLLDLKQSTEKLLSKMHSKTRYNIRLAQKRGIIIKKVENYSQAINDFEHLIQETAQRNKFTPHPKNYYQKMFQSLKKNIHLWTAEYQKQIIVSNLVVSFGDTVTYLHGASANQYRNLMAPHLLQWEQIKWAQKNNFRFYDFWGISDTDPHWAGFTRFKKGFGGQEYNFPGTFDLVYNQRLYNLYKFFKKFK